MKQIFGWKGTSKMLQGLNSRIVLLLLFLLDLSAFALTMAAELKKTRATLHQTVDGTINCVYGPNNASGLAVASMFLLLASQLIVTITTQCLCFGKTLKPGNWRFPAILLFFICWLAFFVAEFFLFYGSERNVNLISYRASKTVPCFTLNSRVFVNAAIFIVITAITSQSYYVSYVKTEPDLPPNVDLEMTAI